MAAKKQGSVAALTKQVAALKKEVSALRATERKEHATLPLPPEQRANMAAAREAMAGEKPDYLTIRPGNANYAGPVADQMAALRGARRGHIEADATRGSSSPLGHGTGSRRRK
jgi:hypothetical protein